MKNLGILIDRPGHSQKFRYLTESLNRLDSSFNTVVFYAEPGIVPVKANFSLMHMVHCLDFKGVMVSTDIYTTGIMLNALRPEKRFFYVWDLEYLYTPYNFNDLQLCFNNDKINLISRNEYRANLLERTWRKSHMIMEEFNYEQLQKLF
jgi:hypothetical protein